MLDLTTHAREGGVLMQAVVASRFKITAFLFAVVTAVEVVGSLMLLMERPEHGFTSIALAMCGAIVTRTTVACGHHLDKHRNQSSLVLR